MSPENRAVGLRDLPRGSPKRVARRSLGLSRSGALERGGNVPHRLCQGNPVSNSIPVFTWKVPGKIPLACRGGHDLLRFWCKLHHMV